MFRLMLWTVTVECTPPCRPIHSVGDDKNRVILARHVPQQMYIHSLVMDTRKDMLTISVVANRFKCPSIPVLVVIVVSAIA